LSKKLDYEYVECLFNKNGYKIFDGENYASANQKIKCLNTEGYIVYPSVSSLRAGKIPSTIGNGNPDTIINISKFIELNKLEYMLKQGQSWGGNSKNLIFICDIHGEFFKTWNEFKSGHGCKYCASENKFSINEVWDGNRLSIQRPDLVKYFENPKDADNYSFSSSSVVQLRCPDCNTKKEMRISKLSYYKFACPVCSDGISIPEKFCIAILNQLGVEFETQKSFNWSQKKRYDFYIPYLNMIIETHGEQHYNEILGNFHSLSKQMSNDDLKYKNAIKNGIQINNYVIVDCRNSNYNWLKESFIGIFETYFDLSNIIWDDVFLFCTTSNIIKACEMWNNGEYSARIIGKSLKLTSATIRRYLIKGTELCLCKYEPNKFKKGKRSNRCKEIYKYSIDGKFIEKYKSLTDAGLDVGIHASNITMCARGHKSTAGGFVWKYE